MGRLLKTRKERKKQSGNRNIRRLPHTCPNVKAVCGFLAVMQVLLLLLLEPPAYALDAAFNL